MELFKDLKEWVIQRNFANSPLSPMREVDIRLQISARIHSIRRDLRRTDYQYILSRKIGFVVILLLYKNSYMLFATTLKKNYGTHVIKLDIAPKTYPLGQHLFISASNNMFYRHSQWDKRHTICVVNLMPQDTKIVFLNRSYLGSKLQPSEWVSDALPMCHICLVHLFWNWI